MHRFRNIAFVVVLAGCAGGANDVGTQPAAKSDTVADQITQGERAPIENSNSDDDNDNPRSKDRAEAENTGTTGAVATPALTPPGIASPAKTKAAGVDAGEAEPIVADTDLDLIELVLVDLFDFDEFQPGVRRIGNNATIILSNRTNGPSFYISDDQLGGEEYPDNDKPVPPDISADLRRRNQNESLSLSNFKPKNPNILVEDMSDNNRRRQSTEFGKRFPGAKGYVKVWLPGYSKDGKTAVVRMWIGPTVHGATATYLLVKQDGRWSVKWRKTAYYS